MSIIDEVSPSIDFYTVELVNVFGEVLAPNPLMPSMYNIIAIVMLQSGFESGFGLGRNSQGTFEPIQFSSKDQGMDWGTYP